MGQAQSKYAVKFMARVGEEHAEDATAVLRESVAPTLRQWGFQEVLAVSRRLEVVESRVLRRLLEEAPAESGYAGRIRDLHETLVMGGPTSYAHSMVHHRDKETYPEEYRLMGEAVGSEENWATVPIRQFDCFGLYDTDVDMKADTLGRRSLRRGRTHSGDLVARELGDLLASPLRGTQHTILYHSPQMHEAISLGYAAQTQVSAFVHRKEARSWIQDSLLPALTVRRGFLGALVLRSRNMGFVAGRGVVPRALKEHRGNGREPAREPPANSSAVLCECVTLWETEADLSAGVGILPESLSNTVEGNLASDFLEGMIYTERGELVVRT